LDLKDLEQRAKKDSEGQASLSNSALFQKIRGLESEKG